MKPHLADGVAHKMPSDLRQALLADAKILELWQSLTPLGQNEFICWVENAKHIETRTKRIRRTGEELLEGKRRPCCWVGCIHRADKGPSNWAQKMLAEKEAKQAEKPVK